VDREALRSRQRPLKERYREDPGSAVVTLRADGELSSADVACSVAVGRAIVAAGLHPMTGGDGSLACSGDLLLQALVACAGVTLRAVATAKGIEVGGTLTAEGDLDVRGTLGLDPDAPVGFGAVRLRFDLTTDAPQATVDELIEATERYCVVLQTLALGVEVRTDWSGAG
jgi:uncharacterized OsmC-like protein